MKVGAQGPAGSRRMVREWPAPDEKARRGYTRVFGDKKSQPRGRPREKNWYGGELRKNENTKECYKKKRAARGL